MPPTNDGSSARALAVQGILDECVDRLAEGESITKEQVIAAHPDLMPELGEELRKLSLIERAQRRAREAGSSSGVASTLEDAAPPSIKDADTIPGYKIVRELHRGGQGIVYEAFQESTRRKVAVKVMKEGPFAGPADEARFTREVQVLGQLRHPNIVAIHDSGSSAGHHYFAMDYVPGQPLDAYMATAQPSMDKTLRLFAKICEAVNAAHLRGVIHRDLKPGNIRIDTDGEPRILDFGLAKVAVPDVWHSGPPLSAQPGAAGPQPMTLTGQFLGSLPWASPEQAEAVPSKIDVRTDVYSLGVILYHMLTGRFPYDVLGNMRDVIDNILTAEPVRPSTIRGNGGRLARHINDEIETIVLKCLQKERDRRYQTAGELARDVNHYLNGEPIEAKRDSLAYVLRKQLKRYRLPAAIVASFVVLITAGLVVSVTFWQQAGAERDEARTQAAIAEAVNEFLNEDLLAQADPRMEPERDIRLRDVLDRTAERIEGRFEEQPLVEAAIRTTLGTTYRSLGEYDAAEAHFERALGLRSVVMGDEHEDALSSINDLASIYVLQGRFGEAEPLWTKVLATQTRVLGAEHPNTLVTMSNLADLYRQCSRYEEAEVLLTEAVAIQKRESGAEHPDTLVAISNLAALYVDQGRLDMAEPLSSGVLEIRERVLGEEHPETLRAMNDLALLYDWQGRYDQAELLYMKALKIRTRVLGPEHPSTLTTKHNLATLYLFQTRYQEAEALYTEVLSVRTRLLGPEHRHTLISMNSLGELYRRQGRHEEAQTLFTEALEIQRRELGAEHADTLTTTNNLALSCQQQGRYDEAERLFTGMLDVEKHLLGPEHPNVLITMGNIANLYRLQGLYEKAEPLATQVCETHKRVMGPEHPQTLHSMYNLAALYRQVGRNHEAESLWTETMELQRRVSGEEHLDTIRTMIALGNLYVRQQRLVDAEPLLLDSYFALENNPDAPAEGVHAALRRIVDLYEAWEAVEPGKGYAEKAAEWRAKLPAESEAARDEATLESDTP